MNAKLQKFVLPLVVRSNDEDHRAATELELLFDLVFVVAIALAAVGLHHASAEAHYMDGLVKFLLAFFALWWPWMSHTWFSSAFDNDRCDLPNIRHDYDVWGDFNRRFITCLF